MGAVAVAVGAGGGGRAEGACSGARAGATVGGGLEDDADVRVWRRHAYESEPRLRPAPRGGLIVSQQECGLWLGHTMFPPCWTHIRKKASTRLPTAWPCCRFDASQFSRDHRPTRSVRSLFWGILVANSQGINFGELFSINFDQFKIVALSSDSKIPIIRFVAVRIIAFLESRCQYQTQCNQMTTRDKLPRLQTIPGHP
jgi:hypothetical protein